MTEFTHDGLAADLAAHLRGTSKPLLTWLDMQLGPAGSPRPDVFAVAPSFTALRTHAFEVKVARSDFLRDVQAGKALGYRKFAGALSFACPKGLIAKGELPEGCGLIERGPDSWRWAKRPTVSSVEMPWHVWMKLVVDGIERVNDPRGDLRVRQANHYRSEQIAREKAGAELAQMLANRDNAKRLLEYEVQVLAEARQATEAERRKREEARLAELQERRDRIMGEIERFCAEIGVQRVTAETSWGIRERLHELRPEHDAKALAGAISGLRQSAAALMRQADDLAERLPSTVGGRA